MQRIAILILLLAGMMVGGCTAITGHPNRPFNPQVDMETLKPTTDLAFVLNEYRTASNKKEIRNDFINARIYFIDQSFEDYQHDLAREGVILDIGADWSQVALSLAAGVVPLAATKTVLSTVSGGIGSAKGSVDKNLFYKKTMEVLLVKMKANRAELLTQIQQRMIQGTALYPLTAALLDLEAYYRAGTLAQALVGIIETAGKTIGDSKDESKELYKVHFKKDENSLLLITAMEKEGFPDKLTNWMKLKTSLKGKIPTDLIFTKECADDRAKAVEELGVKKMLGLP